MTASRPLIEIDRVGMTYRTESGSVEALRDISLSIGDGEFVALVGPSGCGKSTLMRIIAGLRPVTAGRVVVDGVPVAGPVSRVGMVFQAAVLLKWRSVIDNVLLPAELSGQRPAKYRERARQLLELVGLGEFADKQPHELSGGMQQRVALVRAMALGAPVLLMDEPFAALDEITRADMRHLLARLCEQLETTVLFVTHSIAESVFISDRVVVLSARPGRVLGIETIDLPRPRHPELEDDPAFFAIETRLRGLLHEGAGR